jgi:transcriptional regulator with XRE-family HTH domain
MDEAKDLVRLGKAIRAKRVALGLSQEAFADHIGMHRAYTAPLNGAARTSPSQRFAGLGKLLATPPSELLRHAGM